MQGRVFPDEKENTMKKNASRKLTLSRETLRNLEEQSLGNVNGGFRTDASCVNSCDPVSVRICPSSHCTTCQ
jgi:hypothetical protein